MKIAIEALGIDRFGGGRTATLTLLEGLFSLDTENQYLVILSAPEPDLTGSAANVRQWVVPVRNRFAARIWAQLRLPLALRGFDVVHFAKNLTVFGIQAPTIVTVHDLTPLVDPTLFPWSDVLYWRHLQKVALRRVNRIVAVSKDTSRDLQRFYAIQPERIEVIYNACARRFQVAGSEEVLRVRKRYDLPESYVLHVGRIDRKKNLCALVEAFALLRSRVSFGGKLVLVGEEYPKSRDLQLIPTIERCGLSEQVMRIRGLPDADLPAVYSGASVAAFPSLHEGFGLMALEAMACGTPLIAGRAGAVGDVVADAAITLDLVTPENLAEALARVIRQPDLRCEMRQKGLARALVYSQEKAARQALNLYRRAACG